jgi:hypothetical protein
MSNTRFNTCLSDMRAPTPPLPDYDQDKVDEAVLALLYLRLHQPGSYQAWNGFNWDALDRLHQQGLIGDRSIRIRR